VNRISFENSPGQRSHWKESRATHQNQKFLRKVGRSKVHVGTTEPPYSVWREA
jgi:hypothetical protein